MCKDKYLTTGSTPVENACARRRFSQVQIRRQSQRVAYHISGDVFLPFHFLARILVGLLQEEPLCSGNLIVLVLTASLLLTFSSSDVDLRVKEECF